MKQLHASFSYSLILLISKFKTMKKTYNQPECLVVALGTCHMMAESLPFGTNEITRSEDILVKEQNTPSDVNLWDEEW